MADRSEHVDCVRLITVGDCLKTFQHFPVLVRFKARISHSMQPSNVDVSCQLQQIIDVTTATW